MSRISFFRFFTFDYIQFNFNFVLDVSCVSQIVVKYVIAKRKNDNFLLWWNVTRRRLLPNLITLCFGKTKNKSLNYNNIHIINQICGVCGCLTSFKKQKKKYLLYESTETFEKKIVISPQTFIVLDLVIFAPYVSVLDVTIYVRLKNQATNPIIKWQISSK